MSYLVDAITAPTRFIDQAPAGLLMFVAVLIPCGLVLAADWLGDPGDER